MAPTETCCGRWRVACRPDHLTACRCCNPCPKNTGPTERSAMLPRFASCFPFATRRLRGPTSWPWVLSRIRSSRGSNCANSAGSNCSLRKVHSMKKAALSFAIAILSLSSVTAPTAYANGTGDGYYGALAYHRGRAPANAFYGYVAGQTTTFYNGYVPGYGYVALGSTITPYNGYAPYPYSRSGWWQRPVPSAPAAWW